MEDRTNEQFVEVDFSGARFHGVIFSGVRVSDAWLSDVDISGMVNGLSINGVDVTEYVDAELDRRHPERRLLTPDDPDGVRAAWRMIEDLSAGTLDRARALPVAALDEAVDGQWSYLETLRHLVYATDRWITGPVLGDPDPFDRIGRPNDPLDEIPPGLLDLEARPTLEEVLVVRQGRLDRVADYVRVLDQDELGREVTSPNGGSVTVVRCLHVVLREEWWHDQYTNRDLAVLEQR